MAARASALKRWGDIFANVGPNEGCGAFCGGSGWPAAVVVAVLLLGLLRQVRRRPVHQRHNHQAAGEHRPKRFADTSASFLNDMCEALLITQIGIDRTSVRLLAL